MRKIILIVFLILNVSCAANYPQDSRFFSEAKKDEPQAELIYEGSSLSKKIFAEVINGKLANETGKWSGLNWKVPAGKVELYLYAYVSYGIAAYDNVAIEVEEGNKYYIYRKPFGSKLGVGSDVEIYILENNDKKIYSNIVKAEKRRPPKFMGPIIISI